MALKDFYKRIASGLLLGGWSMTMEQVKYLRKNKLPIPTIATKKKISKIIEKHKVSPTPAQRRLFKEYNLEMKNDTTREEAKIILDDYISKRKLDHMEKNKKFLAKKEIDRVQYQTKNDIRRNVRER